MPCQPATFTTFLDLEGDDVHCLLPNRKKKHDATSSDMEEGNATQSPSSDSEEGVPSSRLEEATEMKMMGVTVEVESGK